MPDTEAPATETPETVETPAAAPEPKPGRKQSEAARIAAAAAELQKLEKKPFDPTKAAPAAEPEAPAVEAAPEKPAPADEADKPLSARDPTNANYRIWRNRTTTLEKKEAAFQAREARVSDIEKKLEAWEADKKLLRENPKAYWAKVAKEHGSDFTKEYERFANEYINDGKPETQLSAAMQRIDDLEKKLTEKDQKAEEQRAAEQERQVYASFLRIAVSDVHKNTALTFRRHGEATVMEDAKGVATDLYRKLGRPPHDTEIAAELDIQYGRYYKEIVDSHSGLSQPSQGVAERVNGADQSAKPVALKAPKTLTNGGAAERATPARKLTERERIEAATKLLPG